MKKIMGLERHRYAPEMNKLWYTDGTYDSVPQCTTLEQAENYVANKTKMTHWEFQSTCVKHCISPSIVWDNENFRELVNNDNLTTETLNELLKNQF